MISAQIIFYPLSSRNVNQDVRDVIGIIEASGLERDTTPVSTIVYGEAEKVFDLLEGITRKMDAKELEFAVSVNLSNSCGCKRE